MASPARFTGGAVPATGTQPAPVQTPLDKQFALNQKAMSFAQSMKQKWADPNDVNYQNITPNLTDEQQKAKSIQDDLTSHMASWNRMTDEQKNYMHQQFGTAPQPAAAMPATVQVQAGPASPVQGGLSGMAYMQARMANTPSFGANSPWAAVLGNRFGMG